MYIYTRTPLHVGAGSSVGPIDLPVQRERHTAHPIIPGSSIKGVLRDYYQRGLGQDEDQAKALFGKPYDEDAQAGRVAFGEARLLLFPVRSARGSYSLVTCPMALQRYARDAGVGIDLPGRVDAMHALAGKDLVIEGKKGPVAVLEEYALAVDGPFPEAWAEHLCGRLDDAVLKGGRHRLALVSDGDFSHFVQTCCQVNQHVAIDSKTGTVKPRALFNLETVPSEALFYVPVNVLDAAGEDNPLFTDLAGERLLQFGGNSTTGLGFCTVRLNGAGA
jgi:CRISPR-associated protein Cmr4